MKSNLVTIKIHSCSHQISTGIKQGSELIQLAGIAQPQQLFLEVDGDIDIPITSNDYVIIKGGEEFSIGDGQPPIVDNPCLRIPIRPIFNGQVLGENQALKHAKILGSELKKLDSEYDPSDGLFADLDGLADEPIRDDWRIIIRPDHKFLTTPCGNVGFLEKPDGIVGKHLSEVEAEFETVEWLKHPAGNVLIIRDFPLPDHWSDRKVDLMIIVPNGYPMTPLDMFYLNPTVNLSDGRVPDRGNVIEDHLGQKWQRFSWHYQSRPWNPSKDTLLSHIRFCNRRLLMAQ